MDELRKMKGGNRGPKRGRSGRSKHFNHEGKRDK